MPALLVPRKPQVLTCCGNDVSSCSSACGTLLPYSALTSVLLCRCCASLPVPPGGPMSDASRCSASACIGNGDDGDVGEEVRCRVLLAGFSVSLALLVQVQHQQEMQHQSRDWQRRRWGTQVRRLGVSLVWVAAERVAMP